jgi:MFS transporter, DHA2 family, multidrug resistance protein
VLGGVLLEHFWWGSVFLLAVPVMALLLVLGPRVLPEYRAPGAGRLDLVSAAMLLVAVLAMVFGLKQTAQNGIGWLAVAAILAGLAVGVVFVRRQLGLADPMIDLGLFLSRAFNASLATNLLGIFIVVGYFIFVAQYLQLVLGLSPLAAGLWSLPSAAGLIVGSNLAPRILRRVRPAYVIGAGLALAAVGLGLLTRVGGSADLAILAAASAVVSLGLAPVFAATTDLIVSSAPPERAGAASGISETGAELGGALGIAILGSIGVAIYRGQLATTLPAEVPSQAAAVARDTLGGAVGVAQQLPDGVGVALLGAARAAFTMGLQVTAAISAVVAVGIAVLATFLLRGVPATSQEPPVELPATTPPRPSRPPPRPEEPVQVIRTGAGCLTRPRANARARTSKTPSISSVVICVMRNSVRVPRVDGLVSLGIGFVAIKIDTTWRCRGESDRSGSRTGRYTHGTPRQGRFGAEAGMCAR